MSCDRFEKYHLGEMEEHEFLRHLEKCDFCREQVEQDAQLMSLARSLKRSVEAPHLWSRIENVLEEEQKVGELGLVIRRRVYTILRVAAVIVVAVSLSLYFWPRAKTGESRLLARSVLQKVEKQEKAYIEAIEELEERVVPKMAQMNVELALLYRDRLETIDAQIDRCKEALNANPANAHIRRYMLAALKDKKETLKELLKS